MHGNQAPHHHLSQTLDANRRDPAAQTMKDFTNSGINHIIESPNYSAHKTNTKFFKTIEQSKYLGAGNVPNYHFHTRGNTPTNGMKPLRNNSLWDSRETLHEEALPPHVSKI